MKEQIGFGGGCHWCTEGVFQSLIGISKVEQGWIKSEGENESFSEAIVVSFDDEIISLRDLIEIHLYTHASTSDHSFRKKYRSAVYTFSEKQSDEAISIIKDLQKDFDKPIITKVLPYVDFKLNKEEYLNYLYTNNNNAFCTAYIHPKLTLLMQKFASKTNMKKLNELNLSN